MNLSEVNEKMYGVITSILKDVETFYKDRKPINTLSIADSYNVNKVKIGSTLHRLGYCKMKDFAEIVESGRPCRWDGGFTDFTGDALLWFEFQIQQSGSDVIVRDLTMGREYRLRSLTAAKNLIREVTR